jgi:hypothetical protein
MCTTRRVPFLATASLGASALKRARSFREVNSGYELLSTTILARFSTTRRNRIWRLRRLQLKEENRRTLDLMRKFLTRHLTFGQDEIPAAKK